LGLAQVNAMKMKLYSALMGTLVIGGFAGVFLLAALIGTPKDSVVFQVVFIAIFGLFTAQRLIDAHHGVYRGLRYRRRKLRLEDYITRAVVLCGIIGLVVGMSYCEHR